MKKTKTCKNAGDAAPAAAGWPFVALQKLSAATGRKHRS